MPFRKKIYNLVKKDLIFGSISVIIGMLVEMCRHGGIGRRASFRF